MSELFIQIMAGLIVAITSGVGGFFLKKRFFPETILSDARINGENEGYIHLNGKWHFYWISNYPSKDPKTIWMEGKLELQIKKNKVEGTIEHLNHPDGGLTYKVQGEIRANRMILIDVCTVNDTDYSLAFYPNIFSRTLLIGIWTGLDNLLHPIAAPIILSRREMDADNLNKAIKGSGISLVPIGEYESISTIAFQKPGTHTQN